MIYIINENNPALALRREVKKFTTQSIHTSNGEVLKFRDGWNEATVAQRYHIERGTFNQVQGEYA